MPIEVGIWKLGNEIKKLDFSPMDKESRLEDAIFADISILDPDLLMIGRQIETDYKTPSCMRAHRATLCRSRTAICQKSAN